VRANLGVIVLLIAVSSGIVGCGKKDAGANSPETSAAPKDAHAHFKDRYVGRWFCVNRYGTMNITDAGDKLLIVDDHDQRFTATIKPSGELDCPFFSGGMSYISASGHIMQPNGEFEKEGVPAGPTTQVGSHPTATRPAWRPSGAAVGGNTTAGKRQV